MYHEAINTSVSILSREVCKTVNQHVQIHFGVRVSKRSFSRSILAIAIKLYYNQDHWWGGGQTDWWGGPGPPAPNGSNGPVC